ncbi:MAG: OmpA/MotB [Rhodobacteraceae bacterium]|nr:MAG: OmpA/MotB [Paracoccaceae bacterium]
MERFSRAVKVVLGGAALAVGLLSAGVSAAHPSKTPHEAHQSVPGPEVAGKIEWGVWVDDDGCMHWWADGGLEGYMLDRVNPKTGKPVCLKRNTCLVENTDQLFATDSHKLTAAGLRRLEDFFRSAGAFGYAVYGHTDSRASDEYNMRLSQRRAKAVADVGRAMGAMVEREIGFGEREPVASNATAAGMQKNRRVEVVCYRW